MGKVIEFPSDRVCPSLRDGALKTQSNLVVSDEIDKTIIELITFISIHDHKEEDSL